MGRYRPNQRRRVECGHPSRQSEGGAYRIHPCFPTHPTQDEVARSDHKNDDGDGAGEARRDSCQGIQTCQRGQGNGVAGEGVELPYEEVVVGLPAAVAAAAAHHPEGGRAVAARLVRVQGGHEEAVVREGERSTRTG